MAGEPEDLGMVQEAQGRGLGWAAVGWAEAGVLALARVEVVREQVREPEAQAAVLAQVYGASVGVVERVRVVVAGRVAVARGALAVDQRLAVGPEGVARV